MVVAHWVGAGFLTAGSWVVMGFMMGFVCKTNDKKEKTKIIRIKNCLAKKQHAREKRSFPTFI